MQSWFTKPLFSSLSIVNLQIRIEKWYGMNGAAWCAMFVSWCAYQAGIIGLKVPKYAYCPYGVMDYRARGKYYSSGGGYTPRIGDTIFFWNISEGVVGHTGIVVGVTATEVETIEGNLKRKRGRSVKKTASVLKSVIMMLYMIQKIIEYLSRICLGKKST